MTAFDTTKTVWRAILSTAIGSTLLMASATTLATPKPNSAHRDLPSLVNVNSKVFDIARLSQQAEWPSERRIMIADPTLAFSSYWVREHKHDMTKSDEERITKSYNKALKEVLEEAFEDRGWTIVREEAKVNSNTVVLVPELTDLRIQAPDLSLRPMTKDFVTHVGASRITLTFSLGPAQASSPVAVLQDYDETRGWGGFNDFKRTNRAVNYRDFKFLFKKWAKRSAEFVSEAADSRGAHISSI